MYLKRYFEIYSKENLGIKLFCFTHEYSFMLNNLGSFVVIKHNLFSKKYYTSINLRLYDVTPLLVSKNVLELRQKMY